VGIRPATSSGEPLARIRFAPRTVASQRFHCFMAQSSKIFRRFNNTILTLPLFSLFREIVVNMRTETEYMIYIICRYAPMLYICAKIVDWKRENGENGGKNEFFEKKLPENLWIQKIVVPLQRFRKQTGV
jgi:hypothetical protein